MRRADVASRQCIFFAPAAPWQLAGSADPPEIQKDGCDMQTTFDKHIRHKKCRRVASLDLPGLSRLSRL